MQVAIILKYSVSYSKKTDIVSMIKIKWLVLLREIISICCKNLMELTIRIYVLNVVREYLCALYTK
jgi:hypothetical protein